MTPSPPADFRHLFESSPGCYLVLAPDLGIVAVSDAYLQATMTKREDIVGRGLFEVFPDNPDDPAATGVANLRASLDRVRSLRRADTMAVQKYDIRRPEEEGGGFEERHWSPVNTPVLGDDGSIRYIIHRVEDVTDFIRLQREGSEQHRAAEELRSRAGQMEVEMFRRAQEIQEANRRLRELQADLERRVEDRTADLRAANEKLQREILERERTEHALEHSERQLRQAQKMEAIGRLAGGIAHDFNNLLSVILSYSDTLLRGLPEDDPRRVDLEEVRSAGRRAADLTRQLLAFSRQQVLEPRHLDLEEVLRGLERLLARVLGEDVELVMRLEAPGATVRADRTQLEQVVMNLVVNARDAMPAGGRLTLETARVTLDEAWAREHLGVAAGPYAMLAVSDTGVGMDQELQSKVFEPFFTTKERGKGTGLGLSTALGIVQQSGGSMWLYSEPGCGTTFRIYLPVAAGEAEREPAAAPNEGTRHGSETILLVEDEDAVRKVVASILGHAGYRILEAPTPAEAVTIAADHPERIDLLLTDVVMPRMNGRQVADRVLASRPGLRVLFMSGYTDDVVLHHGVLDPTVAYIQKPLTPDELTRKVRAVLDGGDPSRPPAA